jgi:thiosulfate/3-mercaptopyruvate sulfurtransferase
MTPTHTATTHDNSSTANTEVLVEPDWLEAHLGDPAVRVVEVDVSAAAYEGGHVEGAVLWNIYRDLKDANYGLVDEPAIEQLIRRSGIGPQTTVVLYGYAPAMAMWLLKLYGHADVRILNCSGASWQDAARPWTEHATTPIATTYRIPPADEAVRATYATVLDAIDDPSTAIIDVRSAEEFRGERFWPSGGMEEGGRAGHVPSAVRCPVEDLQDGDGRFRSPAELREIFSGIDGAGDGGVITYCTIGGRASTAWFALTYLLGREHVRVYDGSWAEWGRNPGSPVQCA